MVETLDTLLNGGFQTGRLYLKPRDANMLKAATVQGAVASGAAVEYSGGPNHIDEPTVPLHQPTKVGQLVAVGTGLGVE